MAYELVPHHEFSNPCSTTTTIPLPPLYPLPPPSGMAYELVPHHEWVRDAQVFHILKKLVVFKKSLIFRYARGGGGEMRQRRVRGSGREEEEVRHLRG